MIKYIAITQVLYMISVKKSIIIEKYKLKNPTFNELNVLNVQNSSAVTHN